MGWGAVGITRDKPRLQVGFTYEELAALQKLAEKDARTIRGEIRHIVVEELYLRGFLERPRGEREEEE